jgi:hypothetical protein
VTGEFFAVAGARAAGVADDAAGWVDAGVGAISITDEGGSGCGVAAVGSATGGASGNDDAGDSIGAAGGSRGRGGG